MSNPPKYEKWFQATYAVLLILVGAYAIVTSMWYPEYYHRGFALSVFIIIGVNCFFQYFRHRFTRGQVHMIIFIVTLLLVLYYFVAVVF